MSVDVSLVARRCLPHFQSVYLEPKHTNRAQTKPIALMGHDDLSSPQCSAWSSFHSTFSFSGAMSTVAASPVYAEDCHSPAGCYEMALSPFPSSQDQDMGHRFRRTVALLVNYFAAGLFHGVVPALVYPLFKIRLGLQGYQANAAQTLLGCAWHGKILLCLLTDCVPIRGRRRTPYLYVGWVLVLVVFGSLLIRDPTLTMDSDRLDAPTLLSIFTAASVGYLLVDAACEGIMVETVHWDSHVEKREMRPTASSSLSQSTVHTVRFLAELFGTLLVAIGMNSDEYRGGFSFQLSLQALVVGLLAIALLALGATMWGCTETSAAAATNGIFVATHDVVATAGARPNAVHAKLDEFWGILQQQATWTIAGFGFLQKLCLSFGMDSASPSQAMHEFWLHTDPFTKNLFLALANGGVCVAASVFVHRCLLFSRWRASLLIALVGGLCVGLPVVMMVVFDVWRSKVFFLMATVITGFSDCIAMVVRMLVVVEIAAPGLESSTYGLVTSVYNLADPVATALSNAMGASFRVFDNDIEEDSDEVRIRVAILFAVLFGVRTLVGLGTLPLLRRRQHLARESKGRGDTSKCMAITVFSTIGLAFVAALATNLLSVYQGTLCLRFAGGGGC